MPKIRSMIGKGDTLTIPVDGDEDLVVTWHRPLVTPDVLTQLSNLQATDSAGLSPERANLCYEMSAMLIDTWNLTDDDGPIPTDSKSLKARVDFMVLMEIVTRITGAFRVDPQKGETSEDG